MPGNVEVVRADWLSCTGKVILVSLVNNREHYRVECDEADVERTADLLWADLRKRVSITPAPRASRRAVAYLHVVSEKPSCERRA